MCRPRPGRRPRGTGGKHAVTAAGGQPGKPGAAVAGAGLLYAYVHDTNASVAASYNPAGRVNTVTTLSPGEWLVRLAGPGPAAQTGGMQVTAMDPGAKVCNLSTVWATSGGSAVVRDVNCYLPSGAMDPTQSLVSYDTNS